MSTALSRFVWESRYRHDGECGLEADVRDSFRRVARAVASVERDPERWEATFFGMLEGWRFLPGGRILAGAGTARAVTLFNCFVMGPMHDSIEGIFEALKEGALTLQQGGGIGLDFSTLRPAGTRARSTGVRASGPVPFLRIWNSACETLLSTGTRRGAMMGTLRCDHPDIEAFIDAKLDRRELRHFNLSVLVTDEFMRAVRLGEPWMLVFPERALDDAAAPDGRSVMRHWEATRGPEPCRVLRVIEARALWERLVAAAHASAEPSVLFVDRINRENTLRYCEYLSATNPCGEVPLPHYGACNLGSLNLPRFVSAPFRTDAAIDFDSLARCSREATRFLDDVIDLSRYPLPRQREAVLRSRRIGIGVTGLADMLVMLGLDYDSDTARAVAEQVLRTIREAAWRESIELAREKGSFPAFAAAEFLAQPATARLPADIRDGISRHGLRNSHLTAIAPAGTISLLADNVSSGIEPLRALEIVQRVLQPDGSYRGFREDDFAFGLWRRLQPPGQPLPEPFTRALAVGPTGQLQMLAALQPHVDSGISKTVILEREATADDVANVFRLADTLNLKGCTVFREGSRMSLFPEREDLDPRLESSSGVHCCPIDREAD